jgi:hypothetical protein
MKKVLLSASVLGVVWLACLFFTNTSVKAQSAANFLPPPVRESDAALQNYLIGRITLPFDYPFYRDKYYALTQVGVDGMSAGLAAMTLERASEMERLSAVLDDFAASNPEAYAASLATHNVGPVTPWPGLK